MYQIMERSLPPRLGTATKAKVGAVRACSHHRTQNDSHCRRSLHHDRQCTVRLDKHLLLWLLCAALSRLASLSCKLVWMWLPQLLLLLLPALLPFRLPRMS